jgi:hypothetical protein
MHENLRSSFIRSIGALLLAVGVLTVPALWNGQPIFYPDTPTYLRGAETGVVKAAGVGVFKLWLPSESSAGVTSFGTTSNAKAATSELPAPRLKSLTSIDDKIVLAGRSVYYGLLLYLSYLTGGMWLTVLAQALAAAWIMRVLMIGQWGFRERSYLAAVVALCALTPLGVYTGFLMPDSFAPLVILSAGALTVYWRSLRTSTRWGLSAILLFGLCAHASHVVFAALILFFMLGLRFFGLRWRGLSAAGLVVIAACLTGALIAEWAFNQAVTRTVSAPPLRLPHPMARLIDLGPGTDFLRKNCPQVGYAVCAYTANFPTIWDDFLFSTDPKKGAFSLADASTKRLLSNEQTRFVVDVVRHDPIGVVKGVGANVLKQLVSFRVDLWNYGENAVSKFYANRVPDDIYKRMLQSRAARPSPLDLWQSATTYVLTAIGLMLLVLAALSQQRRHVVADAKNALTPGLALRAMPWVDDDASRMRHFAAIVFFGVVANVVVCATFASSLDRFGARVIWLIPFVGFCAAAMLWRRTSAAAGSKKPRARTLGLSTP